MAKSTSRAAALLGWCLLIFADRLRERFTCQDEARCWMGFIVWRSAPFSRV
jgi:hypothetical protein